MKPFGTLPDGREVLSVEIGTGPLRLRFLNYGAILQDVRLEGVSHSLTLGSDRLGDYLDKMGFFGAIVGPVANRIGGGLARVGGRNCRFQTQAPDGHTLHGGSTGTHAQIWEVTELSSDSVTFALELDNGLGGFPGNRRLTARYDVAGQTIALALTATSDSPSLMNLANHSFWSLHDQPGWHGHALRIAADHYLPVDDTVLPTGKVAAVDGTDFDFRDLRKPAPGEPALDTNFCLSSSVTPLREVAWLIAPSGLTMALATTAPGLQVYDQRAPARPGRAPYEGLALEPQHWPNAPNEPQFPSIALAPGETWSQTTEWRFSHTSAH